MAIHPLWYRDGVLYVLDQTLLPRKEVVREYHHVEGVAYAIRTMIIRGAPAIGVATAYAMALGALDLHERDNREQRMAEFRGRLESTRPTAVNLRWALDRMMNAAAINSHLPLKEWQQQLVAEANRIREEDIAMCRAIGAHGLPLIPDKATVLTYCNAGALATAGYGTALGVVRAAHEAGRQIRVYACETRPFLQGARLTSWELMKDGVDVTLICDNMAGHFLSRGEITCVVVGADRIAANGDFANKIGTYGVALAARENGVPFYVAAPTSTLDASLPDGKTIPIEERSGHELIQFAGDPIAPQDVKVRNPAFDVTPARYVTAIITETGVHHPPFDFSSRRGEEE
ncbi:MAG: Methylthioribose-1-phosphate isomerase [Myxococcota bacterium]|nr:Methylthioribose-1-phosphate isomerase [Myxococcota bacterium]